MTNNLIASITGAVGWIAFFIMLAVHFSYRQKTRRLAESVIADLRQVRRVTKRMFRVDRAAISETDPRRPEAAHA
jgi:Ca2+-dependent lipid-binding protein